MSTDGWLLPLVMILLGLAVIVDRLGATSTSRRCVEVSMLSIRVCIVLGMALGTASAASAQARAFESSEARAAGEALISEQITRYGRVTDRAWDQVISSVVSKLESATGFPGLRIRYVVVGNADANAAAVPGGAIVVNVGLLRLLQDLTAQTPSNPAAQRDRITAFVAAVLSHEIAHVTLGHTDSLLVTLTQRATTAGVSDSSLGDPLSYRSVVRDTAVTVEMLEHSRERELAADRAGALYLLRSGWTIQTAMDLFRALDSLERKDPSFYESISYVRTHPRASTREAALEAFRAQLKFLQADYDDALSLIRSNVALPTAITLLDTVLAYFPDMLPVLHARGTAYHQLWLETVPVPAQQARASLTTYNFRFLPTIRGLPGDLSIYAAARSDYAAVLDREPLALTAVQLALLDAYSGDCRQAKLRALHAAMADSLSPAVNNNRGVVLLVCGSPADALLAFQRAQRLVGSQPVPTLLFNTARAMKAVGDPRAASLFQQYLAVDATSEWAAEARRQMGAPTPEQPAQGTPSAAGEAPHIRGVGLGYSLSAVYAAWGQPSSVSGDTISVLKYPARGISLAVSPTRGVVLIGLLTRDAGAVDGVRVGDALATARRLWGPPAEQREDDFLFNRGVWSAWVHARSGVVASVAILAND